MLKNFGKGVWPIFVVWLGIGFLTMFTYRVLATPSYPPALDTTVQTVYNTGLQPQAQAQTDTANPKTLEGDIFKQKGCIQCHSVSFYNILGGATGPDLSFAYTDAPKRFGKSLQEFLEKPEGTMGDLLPQLTTTEDRNQILQLLSKAAGQEVNDEKDQ
ncbi:hypothetical protein [Desulfosporosinus meridiei]|uniref:Cytochrome c domain-containing protein n=1 Tax=Desulfosporosinus meridiei (strain ATCC BAA-275 / DSM 13257 / KCTC 12902 / NCIMB 13706 / S10) TaxID=768704 RepID=J7J200_DESMD|nr:hypothetical protein [Desulfosporosinus meridiei]AFQ45308.1 hypothetical protein Desmer_3458 [Desulfosporosinus meridiei DSM 13257]